VALLNTGYALLMELIGKIFKT